MGLVAVQLDIYKALNTVPHEAIENALKMEGIPKYVITFTVGSHEGITTVIKHGSPEVPIQIKR